MNDDTSLPRSDFLSHKNDVSESGPPEMKIVNPHLAHSIREQGMLKSPNSYGYIHLAGEMERPHPLRKNSTKKQALLEKLKSSAAAFCESDEGIRRADVFDAVVIPPGSGEGRRLLKMRDEPVHVAAFDIVVLIECASEEAARRVRESSAFTVLRGLLESACSYSHTITAINPKRIDEVDKTRKGVFLFNYFFAANTNADKGRSTENLLAVWEYTAGWWTAKANLTNSTPLQPVEGAVSEYSLINHCRWDRWIDILPHLIFRPSLRSFVLRNFTENEIVAMPILYRLA